MRLHLIFMRFHCYQCLEIQIGSPGKKLVAAHLLALNIFSAGSRISPGDAPTYDFDKFSPKLHEIERIWVPRGGGGGAPLPRSATDFIPAINEVYIQKKKNSFFPKS